MALQLRDPLLEGRKSAVDQGVRLLVQRRERGGRAGQLLARIGQAVRRIGGVVAA